MSSCNCRAWVIQESTSEPASRESLRTSSCRSGISTVCLDSWGSLVPLFLLSPCSPPLPAWARHSAGRSLMPHVRPVGTIHAGQTAGWRRPALLAKLAKALGLLLFIHVEGLVGRHGFFVWHVQRCGIASDDVAGVRACDASTWSAPPHLEYPATFDFKNPKQTPRPDACFPPQSSVRRTSPRDSGLVRSMAATGASAPAYNSTNPGQALFSRLYHSLRFLRLGGLVLFLFAQ